MDINGSQIIIECLVEQGVDTIFGYPGGSILPFYDALYKNSDRIRHVLSSHEEGASHAADGYARSTGKVGVCCATSGPGATNLVTGLATAYMDSVPVIAITGNVAVNLIGKDSFQEVSITGVTMPVTKHNFFVRKVEDLAETVRQAFYIAQEGRPGPVLIDVPKNVMTENCWYVPMEPGEVEPVTTMLSDSSMERALRMIRMSTKPMALVGGGVIRGNASDELRAFIQKIDAPVATTLMGVGAVQTSDSRYLGMAGMHGTKAANSSISDCDLLLAIGTRFSDRVIGKAAVFAHKAQVIHIDVDPSEIDKNIESKVSIVGDVKVILSELLDKLDEDSFDHSEWMKQSRGVKESFPLTSAVESVRAREVLNALQEQLTPNDYVTTEVGQHQMWAAQYLEHNTPRHFITSGGLGTMGFGLGAAIGVQIAHPDSRVVNVAGDGCFRMNCNELGTVARYQLPLIQLVFDNHTLGMVRQWQTLFFGKRYSSTTLDTPVDWCMLANAFGLNGIHIGLEDDPHEKLREAFALNAPVVVDCEIPMDDKVYPMVPPGASVYDMIGVSGPVDNLY